MNRQLISSSSNKKLTERNLLFAVFLLVLLNVSNEVNFYQTKTLELVFLNQNKFYLYLLIYKLKSC